MATSIAGITDAQRKQYLKDGFFVLERAIPQGTLDMLRGECQKAIDQINKELDAKGVVAEGPNHRDRRYFIASKALTSPAVQSFVLSDLMADICRATVGDNAYLFFDQYVVKGAEKGMKFSWHQDSGYVDAQHKPYVSCWCALDDMTIENGTIYVLPYDRAGTKDIVTHKREEGSTDLVGYHGSDPGDPCIVPAGSIVAFSSTLFHRSGFNTTPNWRRSYLVQYSPEVIMAKDGTKPWSQAVELLKNGVNVAKK